VNQLGEIGPSSAIVGESTQGEVGPSSATVGESSGSKAKKKRGRPKKQKQKSNEPVFEDEVLAHQVNINENGEEVPGQSSIVRDRGLSDDEEYNSDELDSGAETEDEEENIGRKHKFPTFKQPENMRDYEWEAGTYFVSKKQFQDVVRTYAVHSGRDMKFRKSDKRRVRVTCKPGCARELYLAKIPNEETWQLRKIKGGGGSTPAVGILK
jgi:hypothetical protein